MFDSCCFSRFSFIAIRQLKCEDGKGNSEDPDQTV